MKLYGIFAVFAVLLAAVGIYGVISYSVGQRRHEIGVRLAIGARKVDILRLIIGQGLRLTVVGALVGVVASLGLARFISSYLWGVTPTDPLTYVLVALFFAGVAVIACSVPASRAAGVDPVEALRYE
jgi:putative ABC transport system permease protein